MTKREARQRAIVAAVLSEGSIRIDELAERFGISAMTVHRDLNDLEEQGLLRKVRGAATALPNSVVESSDAFRIGQENRSKAQLARAALEFIEPGQAVFLDDSTTVSHLVPLLAGLTPLTVITNYLPNMEVLKSIAGVDLVALGGSYRRWCSAFMGRVTTESIEQMRADIFVTSTAAIVDDMCFHQSQETVDIKRAMFEASALRVLAVDHTKFEKRALYRLAALSEFDHVIVDSGTSAEHISRLRQHGVHVIVAGAGPAEELEAAEA
jgi:DeoR/GlpR family transcriptional regulator of sugar metabolism